MKKLLAIVAVLLMAAPAVANDNLLSQLGLSGIQVVTADEASQVSGRGFVSSLGTSYVEGGQADFDPHLLPAPQNGTSNYFSSEQSMMLEGIQALLGAVTSAGKISLDGTINSNGDYIIENGILSVGTGSTSGGSAD